MADKASSTWLLFASGKYAEIDTYLYPASPESSRPIDAYIVSECQGDFTKSARRAADLIYHILREGHNLNPMVVGYDIQTTDEHTLTGRSGGVSFAVSLIKVILLKTGNNDPGDIAATGELLSKGEIGGINGINAKVKAAIHLLTDGSYFFYPSANHKEIDLTLLDQLQAKGVKIFAITNINEVIKQLVSSDSSKNSFAKIPTHTLPITVRTTILLICASIVTFLGFLILKQYITQTIPPKDTPVITQQISAKILELDKSAVTLTPRKLKEKKMSPKQSIGVNSKSTEDTQLFRFAPPIK